MWITIREANDQLHVEVRDDGVGYDPNAERGEESSGFGLDMVRTFATAKLKAEWEVRNDGGTVVDLRREGRRSIDHADQASAHLFRTLADHLHDVAPGCQPAQIDGAGHLQLHAAQGTSAASRSVTCHGPSPAGSTHARSPAGLGRSTSVRSAGGHWGGERQVHEVREQAHIGGLRVKLVHSPPSCCSATSLKSR